MEARPGSCPACDGEPVALSEAAGAWACPSCAREVVIHPDLGRTIAHALGGWARGGVRVLAPVGAQVIEPAAPAASGLVWVGVAVAVIMTSLVGLVTWRLPWPLGPVAIGFVALLTATLPLGLYVSQRRRRRFAWCFDVGRGVAELRRDDLPGLSLPLTSVERVHVLVRADAGYSDKVDVRLSLPGAELALTHPPDAESALTWAERLGRAAGLPVDRAVRRGEPL